MIEYLFNVTSTTRSLVTTLGVRRNIRQKSRATLGYKNKEYAAVTSNNGKQVSSNIEHGEHNTNNTKMSNRNNSNVAICPKPVCY